MSQDLTTRRNDEGGDEERRLPDTVLPVLPAQGTSPSTGEASQPIARSANRGPADLLKLFYAGDDAAFEEFWGQHVREVLRVAIRFVRSSSDALDIAQEVAMAICRRQSFYDPDKGEIGAWLYRLTSNAAISYYRRREREGKGSREYVRQATHLKQDANDAGASAVERQKRSALLECLGCLPPRQREILAMVLIGGLKQVEVARQLGVTEEAVSMSVKRSTDKLRKCLKMRGWEPAG